MPRVAIFDDPVTVTHHCSTATTCEGKSGTVFADGKGVHCVTHKNASHLYTPSPGSTNACSISHSTALAANGATVFADGKAIGRVGDSYACESVIAPNTNTVYADG